jgi:tetratricopeptide (TPR) repeat protein
MLMCACEHYWEATILNPDHYHALKLLGSALYGLGEYHAAEKCLREAQNIINYFMKTTSSLRVF